MKKIILTGGGTAGHVTPNLALIPYLKDAGFDILYVGSNDGIEKQLIEEMGIPYESISTGKLRRYASMKNATDIVRVQHGYHQALVILRDYQPDVVFSKGGFVSVPIVAAAARYKVPVITHESDLTLGLANKINMRTAQKLCCNFPETAEGLDPEKVVVSGCPIRSGLFEGTKEEGYKMTGFDESKPVLMITGGSLGAVAINTAVREALPELLKEFQVVHICGKGNLDESLEGTAGYKQFEYISRGLKNIFAIADVIISRAGANAICEFVALGKPAILIPLPSAASRGDQILNAESFEKQGFAKMLLQENMNAESLVAAVREMYASRETYIAAMEKSNMADACDIIMGLINSYVGENASNN